MRLRNRQVSWRELDGESVVLDLASSKYLTVNSAGTVLLRMLARGDCTRDELAQALVAEFDIELDQANSDVDKFVDDLRGRNLLGGD
ncbi:MAG TPA: PqqD family protein [Acidothermaceae bacterium]|jgi:hypothetical protein|nr:PqqD family protein [Acidothermaceae bacterium]